MLDKFPSILIFVSCILNSLTNTAYSSTVYESELTLNSSTNHLLSLSLDINSYFSSEYNGFIGDISGNNVSVDSVHVSISGTGDGTFDYYSFTAPMNSELGIFDIDYGYRGEGISGNVDTELFLWRVDGDNTFSIIGNDDSDPVAGGGGSVSFRDPFIQTMLSPGSIYVIGVAAYDSTDDLYGRGWTGKVLDVGQDYSLRVAITGPDSIALPIPPAIYLFLAGFLSIFGFFKKSKNLYRIS